MTVDFVLSWFFPHLTRSLSRFSLVLRVRRLGDTGRPGDAGVRLTAEFDHEWPLSPAVE